MLYMKLSDTNLPGPGRMPGCRPVFLRQHDQAHFGEISAWLDQVHGNPH